MSNYEIKIEDNMQMPIFFTAKEAKGILLAGRAVSRLLLSDIAGSKTHVAAYKMITDNSHNPFVLIARWFQKIWTVGFNADKVTFERNGKTETYFLNRNSQVIRLHIDKEAYNNIKTDSGKVAMLVDHIKEKIIKPSFEQIVQKAKEKSEAKVKLENIESIKKEFQKSIKSIPGVKLEEFWKYDGKKDIRLTLNDLNQEHIDQFSDVIAKYRASGKQLPYASIRISSTEVERIPDVLLEDIDEIFLDEVYNLKTFNSRGVTNVYIPNAPDLETVVLPNALKINIGGGARGIPKLENLTAQNAQNVHIGGGNILKEIHLPNALTITLIAYHELKVLSADKAENVSILGYQTPNTQMTSLNLPMVKKLSLKNFHQLNILTADKLENANIDKVPALQTIDLPSAKNVCVNASIFPSAETGESVFGGPLISIRTKNLETIRAPNATFIDISEMEKLERADFPSAKDLHIANAPKLQELRANQVQDVNLRNIPLVSALNFPLALFVLIYNASNLTKIDCPMTSTSHDAQRLQVTDIPKLQKVLTNASSIGVNGISCSTGIEEGGEPQEISISAFYLPSLMAKRKKNNEPTRHATSWKDELDFFDDALPSSKSYELIPKALAVWNRWLQGDLELIRKARIILADGQQDVTNEPPSAEEKAKLEEIVLEWQKKPAFVTLVARLQEVDLSTLPDQFHRVNIGNGEPKLFSESLLLQNCPFLLRMGKSGMYENNLLTLDNEPIFHYMLKDLELSLSDEPVIARKKNAENFVKSYNSYEDEINNLKALIDDIVEYELSKPFQEALAEYIANKSQETQKAIKDYLESSSLDGYQRLKSILKI